MAENVIERKGLTGFQLKYLALALMVLDHIHYFFGFTGYIPELFSMLGRLAAPLFLFCVVEGFVHTHDRKKYFLRIYAIAIGMGLIQYAFFFFPPLVRGDGFFPQNGVFQNFVILIVILQGFEWCKAKHWGLGLLAVIGPVILPYALMALYSAVPTLAQSCGVWANLLYFTVLPLHTGIADGGTTFIFTGVLLYLFRKNRKVQAAVFFVAVVLMDAGLVFLLIPGATVISLFTTYYEWFEAFAAIFMLLYNGQRGTGSKRLFYWFYPTHVYVLYILSYVLYSALH
jgi:hypothetical protein